jgi:hypothetical protein
MRNHPNAAWQFQAGDEEEPIDDDLDEDDEDLDDDDEENEEDEDASAADFWFSC